MGFAWSLDIRNARLEAIRGQIDRANAPGRIRVYATTQPTPGGASGGAPMVSIVLQKPCGTVANGVLTFATSTPAQINPGGGALWARVEDGDGYWLGDGNVAVTGTPGAAFTLADTTLYAGAFLFLFGPAASISEPTS